MPTEIIDPSHPDFEAERRKGVGASEAAQACNVSEYGSAFELWERKTGRTPPKKQTMAMEIGNALEGLLIDKFCRENPAWTLVPNSQQAKHRDKDHPYIWATVDAMVSSGIGDQRSVAVLECKTTTSRNKNLTEDKLPTDWFCQAQVQMHVAGAPVVFFSILVDKEWQCRQVQYNQVLADRIIGQMNAFWGFVSRNDVPPAAWAQPEELDDRLALLPESSEMIYANDEDLRDHLRDDVEEYEELGRQIKELSKQRDERKQRLLLALGDVRSGLLPDGRLMYVQKTSRKGYVVAPSEVVSLKIGKAQ